MHEDISPILDKWPYEPDGNIRKIVGRDGREKIQIRVCIDTYHGVLQFNCDGRPDGTAFRGFPFALDYYEDQLRAHRDRGELSSFGLSTEQVEDICSEGVMIYHRYVVMLQLGDYDRVIRDTIRNMRLFRFVNSYGVTDEDRNRLEKWWPYIIRIHHTAVAAKALRQKAYEKALEAVRQALQEIEDLPDQDDEVFQHEKERSVKALTELEKEIDEQRPLSPLDELEKQKRLALAREDYEAAAALRDEIRRLKDETQEASET